MKKFIVNLVLVVCACTMLLCGCGSTAGLKDNPATDAAIIGNGGYSVVKGDYLYYVNGFLSDYKTALDDYKKDNVYGKVVYGAIYRTKLVNDKVEKDEKGFLKNTERVVPKVVGFENGGFYIVGDYIYYGTPYMQKNADGVLQNDRVSINRIKIDGTGNKEMYVTSKDVTDLDWKVYNYNNNAYVVVAEDKKVVSIRFDGKKLVNKTVVEEAGSFVLNDDLSPANEYVYYTRSKKDDEKDYTTSGNLLCKASFITGEETVYEMDKVSTFDIKGYVNNRIYYTQAVSNTYTSLYALNASISLKNQAPVKLSDNEYSSYYFVEGVNYTVVALDSNKNLVRLFNDNGTVKRDDIASSISTVVGVSDNYIYYIDSSTLKRVNITTKASQTVSNIGDAEGKTFLLSDATAVDLDGRYVYVYASYTSATKEKNDNGEETAITSYYLNRIDTFANSMVAEFVGKMEDKHLPSEPEKDETTGETPKWVY